MVESFGDRLATRVHDLGPLCAGIDPSAAQLAAWGRDDDAGGLEFAALATLEAVIGVAAVVKPQAAFYERHGAAGVAVLERVIAEARAADVLCLVDAKRGDIGSTNDAYADAFLGERSPLAADAVTVSPYLGLGAMDPFFARARASGRGVFVVIASSNEDGRVVQAARTGEGETVEVALLRSISEMNEESPGTVGAVLGATRGRPAFDLATLGGPFLVPGVGAQGATPADVGALFAGCPADRVVVNVSRALAETGPVVARVRDAARRWRDDLRAALG